MENNQYSSKVEEEFHRVNSEYGPFFYGTELKTRNVNGIDVHFIGLVNSGGSALAKHYVEYIQKRWPGRVFDSVLEMGCGAGFIGFSILAAGLCKKLVLTDIEPVCQKYVEMTIEKNNLTNTKFYLSDCFQSIPPELKFDLIVSNPPWQFNDIPSSAPETTQQEVHRTHFTDNNFTFATDFYKEVRKFLNNEAYVIWSSGLPLDKEFCRVPGATVLIRPEPPIIQLKKMIDGSGLLLREVIHPHQSMWSFWLLVSEVHSNPKQAFFW